MDEKIFNEILTRRIQKFKCPFCGEWHSSDDCDYREEISNFSLHCPKSDDNIIFCYNSYFNGLHYYLTSCDKVYSNADVSKDTKDTFCISIIEDNCYGCSKYCDCSFYSFLSQKFNIPIILGQEENSEEDDDDENDEVVNSNVKNSQKPKKEDTTMENTRKQLSGVSNNTVKNSQELKKEGTIMGKATNIWEQLYEHSPKENVELVKQWVEKYKPTLKWGLPVVGIYVAYRILNSQKSDFDIKNINKECQKKLGFKLDCLDDKKALKELMKLGGAISGAYAVSKIASGIVNKNSKELTVEQIGEELEKIEEKKNVFYPIVKKAEPILPVAVSVIIVYIMTQKPEWFEKVKEKANNIIGENLLYKVKLYFDMLKGFILDKLSIDVEDVEKCKNLKLFMILAATVGISALIYGKRVFGDKAVVENDEEAINRNEKFEKFISQLTSIMQKLLPTAFAGISTFLITKNIIKEDEIIDDDENDDDENFTHDVPASL